jgi:prepilin-type N-terminal cleavage/methylation domain-containing protein
MSIKCRRGQAGLTLIELLVSTAIASFVAIGLASLVFYTSRSFAAMANYVDLDQTSRQALDIMSRDIRQAKRLLQADSTSLTIEDADGGTLSYDWDPNEGTLVRSKNGTPDSEPLLKECIDLEFSVYQRNPKDGVYDQYPAATAATCKLVQLHWVCRRTTLGTIVNTESVQSAKVVIRKQ